MIAHRIEDLIVWQLANQLKRDIYAFTTKPPASRDFKYRDQIRDAAASVTRNTAEGFGLFRPKQFKNFLAIAAGSLQEVKDELHDGLDRGYLTADEHLRLLRLTLRALKANRRLQAYLATCNSHENWTETPPT
jgi:four helix bundle protein